MERRTGRRDRRLDKADVPVGFEHLWHTFWAMYQGEPITFAEMRAWSSMTGEELTPWEVETLRTMSLTAMKESRSG